MAPDRFRTQNQTDPYLTSAQLDIPEPPMTSLDHQSPGAGSETLREGIDVKVPAVIKRLTGIYIYDYKR